MLPALKVYGAPEQYVLKPQGIYCEAKYKKSIEEIADASSDHSLKRAVGAAFMSGECINSGIEVPSLIEHVSREQTSHGSFYYCYMRRGQHERLCSDAPSITTVGQLQAERTGDFEVIAENDKVLVARCVEGGRVFVEKGAHWRRVSTIFFGVDKPLERKVNPDREWAARDGCKGLDF
jgi:hypothetical protein